MEFASSPVFNTTSSSLLVKKTRFVALGNEYDCVGEVGVCSWIKSGTTHKQHTQGVFEGVPAVWRPTTDQSGAADASYMQCKTPT